MVKRQQQDTQIIKLSLIFGINMGRHLRISQEEFRSQPYFIFQSEAANIALILRPLSEFIKFYFREIFNNRKILKQQ
ncbi:unnamed protein product [Paramecium sonneborni]|uniref:Uncharacterized protein n=1 Tax=Paramecium sonneborni TaxID=65129 RepID=A0A8S1JUU9_9CILI|nr:unnamed protein product [Paramecium sonneborni]CAD8045971.1 unnamed protein product [Paramecium sonneborni]